MTHCLAASHTGGGLVVGHEHEQEEQMTADEIIAKLTAIKDQRTSRNQDVYCKTWDTEEFEVFNEVRDVVIDDDGGIVLVAMAPRGFPYR